MEEVSDIWSRSIKELRRGTVDPKHPYRYGTLCTSNLEDGPSARTVVIREILEELNFLIYTDNRAKKVDHINNDERVSLHFYHPKKREQIRIHGAGQIINEGDLYDKHRDRISENGARDYNSVKAPGSPMLDDDIERSDRLHFCLLRITASQVDFLKIDRPKHIRLLFKKDNDTWLGEKVVP